MITTSTDKRTRHSIQVCNGLLRGEVSAKETYETAIERFSEEPEVGELWSIRHEHARSVDALREYILSMGGVPNGSSGPWQSFAAAVEKADGLLGDSAVVQSLLRGEEHCQTEYLNALDDIAVLPECKRLIRAELLRRANNHLLVLQALARSV
ncbi:MAG TPA: DUF2383 domain-containing protein [Verrucomicrobiales bacterium]|nr:DUF2383 domain-containing protein [Verrucomicrobiales bacterium]